MEKIKKLTLEDFHRPDSIPKKVFPRVNKILKSGELFRYIGDTPNDSEVALLEKDFAEYLGVKYALAVNSCSSAIFLSLLCCGVKPRDKILVPSFTFTAVPSAIIHAGATPILVECNERFCIDIEDLKKKISPKTKVLLLSHMRGHTSDMDLIVNLCKKKKITLIEDAAHSLGVLWDKKPVGTFGSIGCYSFQTYKMINAGEGGLLVTNDESVIAKAIYMSGAYENSYKKHFVGSKYFKQYQNNFPAFNLRMNNISAAIIRPQIKEIENKISIYNKNYKYLVDAISISKYISIFKTDSRERMAPDTIQFVLKNLTKKETLIFMKKVRKQGVSLYVIGAHKNNARAFWNWKYIVNIPSLSRTKETLKFTCDIRLPIFFRKPHLDYLAKVIINTLDEIKKD